MLTVRRELLASKADNVDSLSVSGEEEESIKSNLKQSRSLRSIKNHESLQTQLIKIFFFFKNFKQRFLSRVVCVVSQRVAIVTKLQIIIICVHRGTCGVHDLMVVEQVPHQRYIHDQLQVYSLFLCEVDFAQLCI